MYAVRTVSPLETCRDPTKYRLADSSVRGSIMHLLSELMQCDWLACIRSLKTWSNPEGNIRLSEDDGPSSREFLDNDDDDDAPVLDLTDSRSLMDVSSEARLAFSDSPQQSPPVPIPIHVPEATLLIDSIGSVPTRRQSNTHAQSAPAQHTQYLYDVQTIIYSLMFSSPCRGNSRSTTNSPLPLLLFDTPPSNRSVASSDAQAFIGRSGSQIILDVLIRNGVEHAFAYPGAANVHLLDVACSDARIQLLMPRHEQGAGHMAEGYSRAAGKPSVVFVTSGPGATNVITPLQDAMSDGIPLIVIAGQVATKELGTGAFQDADIVSMTQPCTKWATMVGDVEDLPAYIDEAFRVATSGRPGPVLLSVPRDVFASTLRDDGPRMKIISPSLPPQTRPPPAQLPKPAAAKVLENINEAAARINNSKMPLIIAGVGVCSSPDGPRLLRQLALRGNIPVATTLHGLGAFDEDHPLSLHMLGVHGSVYGNYAVQRADTILVLGARLDDHVTANIDDFAAAARSAGRYGHGGVIHFEIDPRNTNRAIPSHIPVIGDVVENLKMLEPLIEPRPRNNWLEHINEWKTRFPFIYVPSREGQRVKPQEVLEELDRQTADIKDEVLITTGVGHHQMWAAQFYTWKEPRSLISSGALAVRPLPPV
ncbi:Acetolactate synthase, mitochondrial [Pleurotus pulmonarius]|nr:Acetolactate synthase, mitochondrial [Pleurotus pulmonarius]